MSDESGSGCGCAVILAIVAILFILMVTGVPCNGDHWVLGCDCNGASLEPIDGRDE